MDERQYDILWQAMATRHALAVDSRILLAYTARMLTAERKKKV